MKYIKYKINSVWNDREILIKWEYKSFIFKAVIEAIKEAFPFWGAVKYKTIAVTSPGCQKF